MIPLIFDVHVNIAAGISSAIAGIGLIGFPYMFDLLISHFGWRYSMVILSCISLQGVAMAAMIFPSELRRPKQPQLSSHVNICRDMFSWPAILLYGSTFLGVCPALIFSILVPDHALSCGLTALDGSLVLTIAGVGNFIGRFGSGLVGNYTKGKSVLLIMMSFSSRTLMVFLPRINTFWPMTAIAFVVGIGWGVHASVFATSIAEVFGLRLMPHIVGITFLMIGLPPYVALPFSGELTMSTT